MKPGRQAWIAIVVLLGITAWDGVYLIRGRQQHWVVSASPTGSETLNDALRTELKRVGDDPGSNSDLVTFYSADSRHFTITAAEGTFETDTIAPILQWQRLTEETPVLLMNSVDEIMRNDGGISEKIGIGCNLQSRPDRPMQIGAIDFSPCRGQYKTSVRVDWVASAALVVWNAEAGRSPCRLPWSERTDIDQCLEPYVKESIMGVFAKLREGAVKLPLTIILPSLGTGTGGLNKRSFFSALEPVLMEELSRSGRSYVLPGRLILMMWHGESIELRAQARAEMARFLSRLADRWQAAPHSPAELQGASARMGMILAIVFAFLAALHWEHVPSFLGKAIKPFATEGQPILLAVGWTLGAFGVLRVIQDVLGIKFAPDAIVWPFLTGVTSSTIFGWVAQGKKVAEAALVLDTTSEGAQKPGL